MVIRKHLIKAIIIVSIITLNSQLIHPMQQQLQQMVDAAVEAAMNGEKSKVAELDKLVKQCIDPLNRGITLAHNSNANSLESQARIERISALANQTAAELERVKGLPADLQKQAQAISEQLVGSLVAECEKQKAILEEVRKETGISDEARIAIEDKKSKAYVDATKLKWEKIQEILRDPKTMVAIAATIIVIALCIYIIKYGTPAFINYLTKPKVIIETSRPGLFEWFKYKPIINIDDLIFIPPLQKQLFDLSLRVKTAKKYNEGFPNVLFYGAPGTGKTTFVKALAYSSGLDYALTSGSEFAKITDLNLVSNELRKLLNWAKRSKSGLIIFIDEAESLFANRKLQTTSKATQDLINIFLALISDQSQKKVMFIFATNHPFKLDDAITNRIGINIEFTMPEAPEREKILFMYLVRATQENEVAIVDLHPEMAKSLPKYAETLKGFSPRAIKFIAEEMVVNARRQESKLLTTEIAQAVIDQAKRSLQQTEVWEKERNEWAGALHAIHA